MRGRWAAVIVFVGVLAVDCASLAQEAALAPPKLEPRKVTLAGGPHSVADILKAIEAQTGNFVLDRRTHSSADSIDLRFNDRTYWQAVDLLASKLDARVSLYGDGGPALVDGPRRGGIVTFDNVCRFEIKTVSVQRNFEVERQSCSIDLEIAWEPGFEPLYMTVDNVRGKFAADANGQELEFGPIRNVSQPVSQRRAQVVDLRLPGPDRTSPKIASLSGEVKFLGSPRMLTATFKGLKPGSVKQSFTDDEVTVNLNRVNVKKQYWEFTLEIVNPVGMPAFESFQSWLDNNRIHLERTRGGKKEIWLPKPNDLELGLVGRKANVLYRFDGPDVAGSPEMWTLVYRTPGRIGIFSVPFEFKNVALP